MIFKDLLTASYYQLGDARENKYHMAIRTVWSLAALA